MEILEIKDLEDCFDGTFIKEVLFPRAVTREFIEYLGRGARLAYYPDFPRPFYKIEAPGRYILKGVEGNKSLRLILNRKTIDESLAAFEKRVAAYE